MATGDTQHTEILTIPPTDVAKEEIEVADGLKDGVVDPHPIKNRGVLRGWKLSSPQERLRVLE